MTTSNITGLCQGMYTVTITDNLACDQVFYFDVYGPGGACGIYPDAQVYSENISCDGQINLNPTSSNPPYTFNWSTTETTQNIAGLCQGIYTVTITDNLACEQVEYFEVFGPGGACGIIANEFIKNDVEANAMLSVYCIVSKKTCNRIACALQVLFPLFIVSRPCIRTTDMLLGIMTGFRHEVKQLFMLFHCCFFL